VPLQDASIYILRGFGWPFLKYSLRALSPFSVMLIIFCYPLLSLHLVSALFNESSMFVIDEGQDNSKRRINGRQIS
jgi:hypothetical protein